MNSAKDSLINDSNSALLRFCLIMHDTADASALINIVAGEAYFVRMCRDVAFNPNQDFERRFLALCNEQMLNAGRIQRRSLNVARALRLGDATKAPPDYYGILGVPADANQRAIKQAFRKRAKELHPDRRKESDDAFLELQDAYRHLSDVGLRRRYDKELRSNGEWIEPVKTAPPARRQDYNGLYWVVGGLLIVLVAAAFVFDLYYNETSVFDRLASVWKPHEKIGDRPAGAPAPALLERAAPPPIAAESNSGAAAKAAAAAHAPTTAAVESEADRAEEQEGAVLTAHRSATGLNAQPEGPEAAKASLPDTEEVPPAPAAAEAKVRPTPAAVTLASRSSVRSSASRAQPAEAAVKKPAAEAAAHVPGSHKKKAARSAAPASASRHTALSRAPTAKPVSAEAKTRGRAGVAASRATASAHKKGAAARAPTPDAQKRKQQASATARPGPSTPPVQHQKPKIIAAAGPSPPAPQPTLPLNERLQAFLKVYCRTYASKNLHRFLGFFSPDATEQGKPIQSLLPAYRKTFSLIKTMDYAIRIRSVTPLSQAGRVRIEGRFEAHYQLQNGTYGSSSGKISMEIVEQKHGEKFQIERLNYTIE